MSYQVFMSIWGGFAILIAAGLLLAWIQRSVRGSRQTDPYEAGAAQALRDAGITRLSVRQFGGLKGLEFARGEPEDLGSGSRGQGSGAGSSDRTNQDADTGVEQGADTTAGHATGTPSGTGTDSPDADTRAPDTDSARIHWLVLEGRGRSPLFDYEIHREVYTPEARQKLEQFAADFNQGS